MQFAKITTALLTALLVGFAFGQSPAARQEATKLERLHEERIEVYSEWLELAHARGSHGHEQQRKLFLAKIDAAKTSAARLSLAEELLAWCTEYERTILETTPDDIDAVLQARMERIEAGILVEQLAENE